LVDSGEPGSVPSRRTWREWDEVAGDRTIAEEVSKIAPMDLAAAAVEPPERLVESIRGGGDAAAEARLVERYGRGVRNLLARHTRSPDVAEDLLQDTFALAAAKLRAGELREPAKLPGFLAGLARSLAIEHYRKEGRRRTDVDSEAAEAGPPMAAGQLDELLRDEEALLVRRVLGELSTPRDREILFRYYIAEEEREAIAADHGVDVPQLNRVLHRARQRYKELYLARLAAAGRRRSGAAAPALLALVAAAGAFARLLGALKG
jgi:RNA polymerase sigma-70 factor, ECF subfamily